MNEEFVPYEQALALRKLGFNEPCLAHYNQNGNLKINDMFITEFSMKLKAPLYQQVFRWFRKKHDLYSYIDSQTSLTSGEDLYDYVILLCKEIDYDDGIHFKSYEEAELACLNKLIEIIKNKHI